MPSCPQCSKPLVEMSRQCPSCRADLDLLVDYVQGLKGGLSRAEEHIRAGNLSQAVWAYLEVLETDPDNAAARAQVGQIATAVRHFDSSTPARRWAQGLPMDDGKSGPNLATWIKMALIGFVVLMAFGLGYVVGVGVPAGDSTTSDRPAEKGPPRQNNQIGGPPR